MRKAVIPLAAAEVPGSSQIGGKAAALAYLFKNGFNVPNAIFISTQLYHDFIDHGGIRERMAMELNRKNLNEMRWEEIWDTALRIRHIFLTAPFPEPLRQALVPLLEECFGNKSVVIRSSGAGEDSPTTSFAGLHESYVNLHGTTTILEHIRLVWASLWSDRALLYRRELGLDIVNSAMAVVVQEIVAGDCSGIIFSQNPNDSSQSVIEAVYGLNQGLVDGTVEPDRWVLERPSGQLIAHTPVSRKRYLVPSSDGTRLAPLPSVKTRSPPLNEMQVRQVFALAQRAEAVFSAPQDVEWTFQGDCLYLLQSRPITKLAQAAPEDKRPWYLSLHRSFENLETLRFSIEKQWLPAMDAEAARLAEENLEPLSNGDLARAIEERKQIYQKWKSVYWDNFIPFAHGFRLFGQFYNDTIQPQNPDEFIKLLKTTDMISLKRNQMLMQIAADIRSQPPLVRALQEGNFTKLDQALLTKVDGFLNHFSGLSWKESTCFPNREAVLQLLSKMIATPSESRQAENPTQLTEAFLNHYQGEQRSFASKLLELARASYRLRDDDNIFLGKIETQAIRALEEARQRLKDRIPFDPARLSSDDLVAMLRKPHFIPKPLPAEEKPEFSSPLKARQIIGQPASAGVAFGKARVLKKTADLFQFEAGEILVCDAIDPNMTFIVPLAAGIVECRGGMLIHGAIIAREYGIPCVTGIAKALSRIHTGDRVTVDGYLGIVTCG